MQISRRTMLRGAGALMALPFLESLAPLGALAGTAAKGPPRRVGIFTVTGGTVIESWKPKEVGPLGKLPSILRPLEFAKDDLLVVSGLRHHGRRGGAKGGRRARARAVGGPSRGAGRRRPDVPAVARTRPRRAREPLLVP